MNDQRIIEILLVEDNPRDARVDDPRLQKTKPRQRFHLIHVEDGVEALDFLFNRGKYAERRRSCPGKDRAFGFKTPETERVGSFA